MRLARYVLVRLLLFIPVVLGVVAFTFFAIRVLPGDPVQAFVGPTTTAEDLAALRERLGLDVPLGEQFLQYMQGVFSGDFGTSIQTGTPIATELAWRMGPTFELVFLGVGIALIVSLVLGIVAALRANKPFDHVTRVGSLVGTAMPEFWLALLLIVVGYAILRWFPGPSGRIGRGLQPTPVTGAELPDALLTGNVPSLLSAAHYLVLPVLAIAIGASAALFRSVRSSSVEIMSSEPYTVAQAHGLNGGLLVRGYLVRGTLARLPTLVALVFGAVLGTVVLIEYVFSWQGMGQWLLRGLLYRDYPVVQAGVAIIALVYATAYLVADVVQAALDPRIQL